MTKLTTDIALKSIDHQYIKPIKFINIIAITTTIIKADQGSIPSKTVVTQNIEANDKKI